MFKNGGFTSPFFHPKYASKVFRSLHDGGIWKRSNHNLSSCICVLEKLGQRNIKIVLMSSFTKNPSSKSLHGIRDSPIVHIDLNVLLLENLLHTSTSPNSTTRPCSNRGRIPMNIARYKKTVSSALWLQVVLLAWPVISQPICYSVSENSTHLRRLLNLYQLYRLLCFCLTLL